jgi:hypothetical protein
MACSWAVFKVVLHWGHSQDALTHFIENASQVGHCTPFIKSDDGIL